MDGIFGYPDKIKAKVILQSADPNAPFGYILEQGPNITLTYNDVSRTLTITASGGGDTSSTYVTVDDETGTLTNSRQVVAGNNVTIDTSIPGQLIFNAAATGGGAPTTASYVTIGTEPSLSAERVLTEAYGISITDNTSTVDVGLSAAFLALPFLCLSNPSGLSGERKFTVQDGLAYSDHGANDLFTVSASPLQAPEYVVTSADATLPNAKVLTPGTGLDIDSTGSTVVLTNTASSYGKVMVNSQTLLANFLQDQFGFADGTNITLTLTGSTITVATTAEVNQNAFNTISVSGQNDVVADTTTDTLNFAKGTGIDLTTNETTDTVTFTNTASSFGKVIVAGQDSIYAFTLQDQLEFVEGSNITLTVSGSTLTITTTADANQNAFSVVATQGWPNISAGSVTDTLNILAQDGLYASTTGNTLVLSGSGIQGGNSFGTITVSGQSDVDATVASDSVEFEAGSNIIITTSAGKVTFTSTASGGSGSGAPLDAQYIVLSTDPSLTDERVLVVNTDGLSLDDGGAGSNLTLTNTASSFGKIEVNGQTLLANFLQDQFKLVDGTNITLTLTGSTINIATTAEVNQNAFNTIAVAGQDDVVADSTTDTLNFANGLGIDLTTNETTDTVTVTNTASSFGKIEVQGQSDIIATYLQDQFGFAEGTNITLTVSGSTITVATTAEVNQNAFTTISAPGQSDVVADSTTDTLTMSPGTGMNISTNAGSDTVTFTNTASSFGRIVVAGQPDILANFLQDQFALAEGTNITLTVSGSTITINSSAGGGGNTFSTVAVAGQSDIEADTTTDTLNFAEGVGIDLTTNASTDTLTILNSASSFGKIEIQGQSDVIAYLLQDQFGLVPGGSVTITSSGSSITISSTGEANQNAFSVVAPVGFASISAGSTTDTLDVQGADGVTVGNVSDILTISGSGLQPKDPTLTALASYDTNGIIVQTTADTFTGRTITGTSNRIDVSDGDGVSGNPTIDVGSDVYVAGGTDVAPGDGGTGTSTAPSAGQILIGTSGGIYAPATPSAGFGIDIQAISGAITISSLATGEANQNAFSKIAVAGQSDIDADSTTDTFTLAASTGINITTNASTDTATITNTASSFGKVISPGQSDINAYGLNSTLNIVPGNNVTVTTIPSGAVIISSSAAGGGSTNGLFRAANISSTLRTHPTTGSISGTYVHSGDVTTTGSLTVAPNTKSYIKGNLTLSHTCSVSNNGNGAPHITDGGNANAGGLGPGTSGGYLGGGSDAGGGGAGYGNGGNSQVVTYGSPGGRSSGRAGVTYGGSGGGATYYGAGAAGGGFWYIEVDGNVTINQNLSANGANSSAVSAYSGGGGGGGTIIIRATGAITIASSKSVSCNGGAAAAAGSARGGGGGGGYIELWAPTVTISGSTSVSGGAGANSGSAGLSESITAAPISLF